VFRDQKPSARRFSIIKDFFSPLDSLQSEEWEWELGVSSSAMCKWMQRILKTFPPFFICS
jgi:hypothetical protein